MKYKMLFCREFYRNHEFLPRWLLFTEVALKLNSWSENPFVVKCVRYLKRFHSEQKCKQECIPVGCVPPASMATSTRGLTRGVCV